MVEMPKPNDPPPNEDITGAVIATQGLAQAVLFRAREENVILTDDWARTAVEDMIAVIFAMVVPQAARSESPEVDVRYDAENEQIEITPTNKAATDLFNAVGENPSLISK